MSEFFAMPLTTLVPGALSLYALAFIAGGVYYLEQRVSRIRDQFPERAIFARFTGYGALAIGLLAAVSMGGRLLYPSSVFHLGALVASAAGIAFWVHHLHIDLSALERVRDGLLALACIALTMSVYRWIQTL
jgi:hypothetical protein